MTAGQIAGDRHVTALGRVVGIGLWLAVAGAPALHGQSRLEPPPGAAQRLDRFVTAESDHPRPIPARAAGVDHAVGTEASFGRILVASTAGGVLVGAMSGGIMSFTGWGLSGQSTAVARSMAYVGAIPGVPVGSASGVVHATRGTDRERGLYSALAYALVGSGAGMVVWHNVAGEMVPNRHSARWRRGVAAGIATQSLVTSILAYAF